MNAGKTKYVLTNTDYQSVILMLSVVGRFETQEDTGKHLQELQNRAEKEIRDLGAVKEKLEAEWELVKFMGQEENTELREKLEVLEEDITDQQVPPIVQFFLFTHKIFPIYFPAYPVSLILVKNLKS